MNVYLCEGAGAETQTSNKCCSEDKAADFGVKGDFHDESSCFFLEKGDWRLSKTHTRL